MAENNFLTSSLVTRESMRLLEASLQMSLCVNRQFDSRFGVEGAKIGTVVNARKPIRVVGRTGQAARPEAVSETSVAVPLTTQIGVDLEISQADLLLKIDDFGDRLVKPCVSNMAHRMDADLCTLLTQVWQSSGTLGSTPTQLLTYLMSGVNLTNSFTPDEDERHVIMTATAQAYLVDTLKGLAQQATAIADQYIKGTIARGAGFQWHYSQNLPQFTSGPQGGSPQVNGANQTGSSIVTNNWTAAAANRVKQGDRVTFSSVYQVNPQTGASLGVLQSFVATQDADSDGAGNLTLYLSPAVITSGPSKTVDSSPANGSSITVVGAASTSTILMPAFHRDFATLVTADLPLPGGVDMSGRMSDRQLGVSMTFVRAYDVYSGQLVSRLDLLFGKALLRGELASVVFSGQ